MHGVDQMNGARGNIDRRDSIGAVALVCLACAWSLGHRSCMHNDDWPVF